MIPEEEDLLDQPVFRHFRSVCDIPHGSGNEHALSNHILEWAFAQGLEAEQDEWNNILIRKPASPGREHATPVLLQAHLDMVCEKAEGVEHDFAKDPIQWVIEGDNLTTGGRTTLGADDGIGVALILAVLENRHMVHPPLEALFTTNEEEDMSGAENFARHRLRSRYVINLDNTVESQILCGSCGGMEADLAFPLETEEIPAGYQAFHLTVTGLKGGHSGEDIHRGRGNANVLLARLLLGVQKTSPLLISSIRGGTFRLAIPRDAEAVFAIPEENAGEVSGALRELEAAFREELAQTGESVCVSLEPAESPKRGAKPDKVLDALSLMPDGIYQMNEALEGLVDTSDNMGEVYLEGDELKLVLEIRSARESLRTWLGQRMERLAALLGGTCSFRRAYPSWNFHPKSPLRETVAKVFRNFYGKEPDIRTVHAGLEVGYLMEGRPDTDAVSLGPDVWDFHSPSETANIPSCVRFLDYLEQILGAIS